MVPALDLRFRNIIEAHGGYLSHQTDSDLSGGGISPSVLFLEIVKHKVETQIFLF
jgi:hypothetical protein